MAANEGVPPTRLYDLCIVGAGMIGSAAARHATLFPKTDVCLIGPEEPKNRSASDSRTIYGAYYDEGRITRSTDRSPIWASLAQKSIHRYQELEERTGINFYNEVGCLTVGEKNSDKIRQVYETSRTQNVSTIRETADKTMIRFPYLNFSFEDEAVFESCDAGTVNPRKLVCAEQTAAHLQGCHVIRDIVCQVTSISQSGVPIAKIATESGHVVHAKRVLLCTGAFTSLKDLLPKSAQPDVILKATSVVFGEVDEEHAKQMRNMPCLIYTGSNIWGEKGPPAGQTTHYFGGAYILPPIQYPDGRHYIKLGETGGPPFTEIPPSNAAAVKHCYCSPPSNTIIIDGLKQILLNVFKVYGYAAWAGCTSSDCQDLETVNPAAVRVATAATGVPIKSMHLDACIVTRTPTGNMYIDMVTPQIGVALGGNGYAAKSCDEIGRLAVHLVLQDKWLGDFPREIFRLRVKSHL